MRRNGGSATPTGTDDIHILKRGTPNHAAQAFYTLMRTNDDRPITMHALAAKTDTQHLPMRIASLLAEHTQQVAQRRERYTAWQQEQRERDRIARSERERTHQQAPEHAAAATTTTSGSTSN